MYLQDDNQSIFSEGIEYSGKGDLLLVLGGLRGPSNAPRLMVPLCREPPLGIW